MQQPYKKYFIRFLKLPAALAAAVLLIVSCKKDPQPAPDVGYDYFPDRVGRYVIYEVDSIVQDDVGFGKDTFKFLIKEVVESVYEDNSGRPTMRIERYVKNYNPSLPYDSLQWSVKDVWSATRTASTAERYEENVRYIRLIFPAKEGATWNGNAYNTLEEWEHEITSIDQPLGLGSLSFDSVLTVQQVDESILTKKRYSVEKYAKHIGLVYKETISLDMSGPSFPFNDTSGYYYTVKAIGYGN